MQKVLFFLLILVSLSSCNKNNSYYIRGNNLEQKKEYKKAIVAYKKSLAKDPTLLKAHIKLAVIYEDTFGNLPSAIYHYREYIDQAPDDEDTTIVQKWLTRAEKKYLQALQEQYQEEKINIITSTPTSSSAITTAKEQQYQEKEKKLKQDIKILQIQNKQLIQYIKKIRALYTSKKTTIPQPPNPIPTRITIQTIKHTVKKNETLYSISRKYYQTNRHWKLIRNYNVETLKGNDNLKEGMILQIPLKTDLDKIKNKIKIFDSNAKG